MERSVDDAVNNFKLLTKDKRLVPGAGAVEVELSKRLSEKAEQVKDLLCRFREKILEIHYKAEFWGFPMGVNRNSP